MNTIFLRALEAEDKAAALYQAIHDPVVAKGRLRFEVDPKSFASIPRSPFAYWISDRLRYLFTDLPPFETEGRTACVGDHPGDGSRFLRLWFEVPAVPHRKWIPYQKGGVWSPFYCDIQLLPSRA